MSQARRSKKPGNIKEHEEILCIVDISTYLIYDGFNEDLDGAILYERLMYF